MNKFDVNIHKILEGYPQGYEPTTKDMETDPEPQSGVRDKWVKLWHALHSEYGFTEFYTGMMTHTPATSERGKHLNWRMWNDDAFNRKMNDIECWEWETVQLGIDKLEQAGWLVWDTPNWCYCNPRVLHKDDTSVDVFSSAL